MVPKKDKNSCGTCGNYRRLNAVTKKDRYPVPHINSCLDRLHGNSVFSKLDIVRAYHHIPMAEADAKKTPIITPFGLFEFTCMPFGLCNAAQTFQRFMDSIFRDLPFVFVYLDDILIASKNLDEHKIHVETVLKRLSLNKLHVCLDKCQFCVAEVTFLGFLINDKGIRPLPDKVDAIINFSKPLDYAALRRFLGLIGFYRRFLPKFADIAEPLY